jgi:hypothetical protein
MAMPGWRSSNSNSSSSSNSRVRGGVGMPEAFRFPREAEERLFDISSGPRSRVACSPGRPPGLTRPVTVVNCPLVNTDFGEWSIYYRSGG